MIGTPLTFSTSVTAPPPTSEQRRAARLDARYTLWSHSSLPRVRACGRFVTNSEMGAAVKASGSVADGSRRAGLAGVQSCGSVWTCPVCSQKIQAERQAQVASALATARVKGLEVVFLTLTMRHARAHRLDRLWGHLSTAWRKTVSGSQRHWKGDKDEFGIQGYLRLVEVTHGAVNGWHVHVHVLLFLDPSKSARSNGLLWGGFGLTDDDVQDLGMRMFLRWRKALDVPGLGIRPSAARGVDIRRVRSDDAIAEYFAKNIYDRKGEGSTAHDVTGAHSKDAKNGNRTPFGILRSIVGTEYSQVDESTGEVTGGGFERDLDLWHIYEKASKGRRQLLWSPGLKDLLGITDEKTDQEIVDEDHGGEVLEWMTAPEWTHISRRRMQAELFAAAEADDTGEALCAFLNLRVRVRLPDL